MYLKIPKQRSKMYDMEKLVYKRSCNNGSTILMVIKTMIYIYILVLL